MGKQNYIITDTELLKEGGEECLKSALDHFEAAELLSEKEMYGLACSHLVLATEEACKSQIFLAGSVTGNRAKESFKSLFKSHNTKQAFSQFISLLSLIFDRTFQNLFMWQMEYSWDEISEEKREELLEEQKSRVKEHKKWLKDQQKDKSELGQLASWWRHANHLKKSGFYVDYNNASWESPRKITSTEYEKSYEIVHLILEKAQAFSTLTRDEPEILKEHYADLLEYSNNEKDIDITG